MNKKILGVLAALLASASPAVAEPNCLGGGEPGIHVSIGIGIGEYTESEQAQFDKMHLRQQGIVADSVERTSLGCIKVISRDGNADWTTDYYDPDTFERKPLNLRLP
jgi:hypothetical protein